MKFPRFATVALLTGALMVACGDDDDAVTPTAVITPTAPAPIFGTVSGTVSVEGSGLAEVSVNLTGPAAQSATTGSSGGYSFSNVPAGAHNVGISGTPPDVAFVSTSTGVTIATNGQTATADFSGNYIRTSSITGSVTAGDEGVVATVTAAGSGMLTDEEPAIGSSDTDGNFELTGLRAGGYAVTISDYPEDTEFPVTTRDVTVGVGLSATVSFNATGEDQPTTGTNPFLPYITEVTSGSDDGTYSGRLTATVEIERERGDAQFEKITLYVDATEVDSRSFGFAPAPAEDPELAAQQIEFSLSFDSDEYDEAGAVTYPNGAHNIVVGVTVQGSTDENFSDRREVEFDNEDGVHVVPSGQTQVPVIGQDGGYWYGGPGRGFDLTVVPVMYSGNTVQSVTLRKGFCGSDAASDREAPYVFSPDCGGFEGSVAEAVAEGFISIGAAPVQTLNAEDERFSIQLDYAGPGAPVFMPNPNGREGGWINDEVGLAAEHDVKENDDGWLIYGATDGGVGGNTVQLQRGEDMEGALAATASSTPALPEASEKSDAYCFVASAVDDLGNRSKLPKEDDDCAKPGDYMDAVTAMEGMGDEEDEDYVAPVDAADAVVFSSITAGVDTEAPTIEFTPNSLKDESRALDRAYDLRVKDADSGLHSTMPVLARVTVRNATKTVCGAGELPGEENDLKECKNNNEGLGELDNGRVLTGLHEVEDLADGYYTFTALAQDKAGNESDEESRVAVHDTGDPVVSVAATTGSDDGDFDHNLVGTVTDALSIRDYSIAALVDDVYYGLELVDVDAYDADPTTPSVSVEKTITLPFLGLQGTGPDDGPVPVSMLRVSVRDQAAGTDDDADDVTIADLEASTTMDFEVTPDDDDEASMLVIKALVTSEANPFESVLFYAAADNDGVDGDMKDLRFIVSVPEHRARDNGGIWTYTARVSADDFYAAVGGDDGYSGKVSAVGVRAAGSVDAETETTVTVVTTIGNTEIARRRFWRQMRTAARLPAPPELP